MLYTSVTACQSLVLTKYEMSKGLLHGHIVPFSNPVRIFIIQARGYGFFTGTAVQIEVYHLPLMRMYFEDVGNMYGC